MSELPLGWKLCHLEDCVEILDAIRKPINNKERSSRVEGRSPEELYPYYGATGQVGYIDGYLFDEDLVALGEDAAPFLDVFKDKAYMLYGKTWVNNHAHVLRGREGVNNKYLCNYLNQVDYRDYVNGATRLKLTQANMRKLLILLAPANEQIRIVNKLDKLLSKVEAAKIRLDKIPLILKRFRQSVLAAATSGKLTEEWRYNKSNSNMEWEEKYLQDIAHSVSDGDHQAPPRANEGIPFIVISNVNKGVIDFDGVDRWVPEDYFLNLSDIRVPKKFDILYTVTGSYGIPVIVDTDKQFCFQRHIAIIKPNNELVDYRYLYIVLGSNHVLSQAHSLATGTAQKTVSLTSLRSFQIPVPKITEQEEIVRRVEELFTLVDRIEKQYVSAKVRVDKLTQSILAKAFRGELVPQDPNDEPADKLMEQIRFNIENEKQKSKPLRKKIKHKATASVKAVTVKSVSSAGDVSSTSKKELEMWLDKRDLDRFNVAVHSLSDQTFTVNQLKSVTNFDENYEDFKSFLLRLLKGEKGRIDSILELVDWSEKTGEYLLRLKK